jgi:hypothetical protein
MSDDEVDPELLALLRQSLGLSSTNQKNAPAETKVLEGARYIYDNSIDVALDSQTIKAAAESIWTSMRHKEYSSKTWSTHELHPKAKNEDTINLIFTIDLLNFCFWSESEPDQRYAVHYRGKNWTGYWSLVAALQRALDEGTCPRLTGARTSRLICPQTYPLLVRISGRARMSVPRI